MFLAAPIGRAEPLDKTTYTLYTISMEYGLVFYRDDKGGCQVLEYLQAMKPAHQAKAKKWMALLEERGPNLPRPYADAVAPGIRELRVPIEHHQHRFLHSFHSKIIVMTNAFLKKTDRVPDQEIEKSRKAFVDWTNRRGWEDL